MKDEIEHQHEFKHTGGGTDLVEDKSDDSYACECGAKLWISNLTPEQHFRMPIRIVLPLDEMRVDEPGSYEPPR